MENPELSQVISNEAPLQSVKALATPGAPLQPSKFEESKDTPTTIAVLSPALPSAPSVPDANATETSISTTTATTACETLQVPALTNVESLGSTENMDTTTSGKAEEDAEEEKSLPLHPLPKIKLPSFNFELQEVSTATALEVTSLDITPHGNYILLGCTNGSIYLHDLSSSTCGVGLLVGFIKVRIYNQSEAYMDLHTSKKVSPPFQNFKLFENRKSKPMKNNLTHIAHYKSHIAHQNEHHRLLAYTPISYSRLKSLTIPASALRASFAGPLSFLPLTSVACQCGEVTGMTGEKVCLLPQQQTSP